MIRFTKDESQPDWHGYFYTALFFINALVLSLFLHQYFHRVNVVGMRIRTAVIAAVYNKVCTDSCYHSRMRYLHYTYARKHNSFNIRSVLGHVIQAGVIEVFTYG